MEIDFNEQEKVSFRSFLILYNFKSPWSPKMKTMAKLKNNKKTIPLYNCFRGAKIDFDLLIFLLEIILLIHFYLEHLLRQLKPGYQDVLQF